MKTSMVGPRVFRRVGQEVELEDWEAARLIEADYAEPILAGGDAESIEAFRREYRIHPEKYLARFPTGPNADEARRALGA